MKHLAAAGLALATFAACTTAPDTSTGAAALSTEDNDVAPECSGILTYANWA